MCGIFSLFSKNLSQLDFEQIKKCFDKIKKRGPDSSHLVSLTDEGSYQSVFFGFHRLSINDLSEKGNQPFVDDELILICNGEIYNSKKLKSDFMIETNSSSDCEVILHLYRLLGIDGVIELLDGVFAFVLYDKSINTVYAGRDPIGVRPLFYQIDSDLNFAIASEAKALEGLLISPIHQLPGGHYMTINSNTYGFTLYHNIQTESSEPEISNSVYIQQNIKTYLIKAIEKRLMSDRDIGCLLSGGVDSSIVAGILSEIYKKKGKTIKTFSIGFPDSEDLKYARKVAEYIGSDHYEKIISYEEALNAIPDVIKTLESYDITTIRASIGMYLLSKYISENFSEKVIFSGEGADEILCGYLYFHYAPSEEDLFLDSRRLVKNLPYFDVLRADRTTAAHGLELRVPFLDLDLVNFCMSISGKYRKPQELCDPFSEEAKKINIEKYHLRAPFGGLIPNDIIWRRKEGFSDGVGSLTKPWYKHIEEFVDTKISKTNFEILKYCHDKKFPSKEAWYYYQIFMSEFFYLKNPIPYYWMPKWQKTTNPSGREMPIFDKPSSFIKT